LLVIPKYLIILVLSYPGNYIHDGSFLVELMSKSNNVVNILILPQNSGPAFSKLIPPSIDNAMSASARNLLAKQL
jgi:hypothetical protein